MDSRHAELARVGVAVRPAVADIEVALPRQRAGREEGIVALALVLSSYQVPLLTPPTPPPSYPKSHLRLHPATALPGHRNPPRINLHLIILAPLQFSNPLQRIFHQRRGGGTGSPRVVAGDDEDALGGELGQEGEEGGAVGRAGAVTPEEDGEGGVGDRSRVVEGVVGEGGGGGARAGGVGACSAGLWEPGIRGGMLRDSVVAR